MDILDSIRAEQAAAGDAALTGARQHANWAMTFDSIPPEERLRATRNLADQVNTAIERRAQLAAETDVKAQAIYYNSKKFQHDQEMEPMRKTLLDAQIEHERASTGAIGMTQRIKQEDDVKDLDDLSGLIQEISELDEREPDYMKKLSGAAVRHARALTLPAGREIFETKSKRHKSITDILGQIPEGHAVKRMGFNGDNVTVETEKEPEPLTKEEKDAVIAAGGTVRSNSKGGWTMTRPPTKPPDVPVERVTRKKTIPGGIDETVSFDRPMSAAAAPATAKNSADKPKMVRQNGVTYTLQTDGSYK